MDSLVELLTTVAFLVTSCGCVLDFSFGICNRGIELIGLAASAGKLILSLSETIAVVFLSCFGMTNITSGGFKLLLGMVPAITATLGELVEFLELLFRDLAAGGQRGRLFLQSAQFHLMLTDSGSKFVLFGVDRSQIPLDSVKIVVEPLKTIFPVYDDISGGIESL